ARTRRQPVVHDDDGLTSQVWHGPVPAVCLLPTLQLAGLLLGHPLDDLRPDTETPDHVVVQHEHIAAADRAHRHFLPAGHTQLTDDEDVEGRAESLGHVVGDWHPTTRKPEDDDVRAALLLLEGASQDMTRIPP